MKTLTGHDGPPARLAPRDARDALAVILVCAARSDGRYDTEEQADIDSVLCRRYGLSGVEAAALRVEAESVEENAAGLQRFTSALKNAVAFEDRIAIIEAVWEVAYADGSILLDTLGLHAQRSSFNPAQPIAPAENAIDIGLFFG
ncbi:MAG: TerB family tellurite resistance protein, partial [Pseudomonadota bacterium]